jgi:Uri superfamily endonuclease
VRARVSRHFRETKVNHWHVDYLREYVSPLGAWISYKSKQLEYEWAQALYNVYEMSAI